MENENLINRKFKYTGNPFEKFHVKVIDQKENYVKYQECSNNRFFDFLLSITWGRTYNCSIANFKKMFPFEVK